MSASSSTPTRSGGERGTVTAGRHAAAKKMNVMQLTFIVAVNMMGSGIIMLPTNMAKVGAISLLSWIVTALGSMAIAWGFAQAGLFNQREGGMSAYAEDAYGKSGYFIVSSCTSCRWPLAMSPSRSPRSATWPLLPLVGLDPCGHDHRGHRASLAHHGGELRWAERDG